MASVIFPRSIRYDRPESQAFHRIRKVTRTACNSVISLCEDCGGFLYFLMHTAPQPGLYNLGTGKIKGGVGGGGKGSIWGFFGGIFFFSGGGGFGVLF
jgi:hypothetical protein